MLGGNAPRLRWYIATARAYCCPRKISSASRSRVSIVCQAGSSMVSAIAITFNMMSSAAMAKPRSLHGRR